MYIDKQATFGEGLDVSVSTIGTDGFVQIGDVIDLGAENDTLGSGVDYLPVLYITACDDYSGGNVVNGTVSVYTSEDGETPVYNLIQVRLDDPGNDDGVIFSGELPTIPESGGRYLMLMAGHGSESTVSGSINAYIVMNAANPHIYPAAR